MSTKEQNRLQILNGVLERYWNMTEAANLVDFAKSEALEALGEPERAAQLVEKYV